MSLAGVCFANRQPLTTVTLTLVPPPLIPQSAAGRFALWLGSSWLDTLCSATCRAYCKLSIYPNRRHSHNRCLGGGEHH